MQWPGPSRAVAEFALEARIAAASEPVALLKLCEARLQDDARFSWIVLVPRKHGARELEHLAPGDRVLLLDEIMAAGAAVRAIGAALGRPVEKLNVATIGNIVPQLHIHVTGRRHDDEAWPDPPWGRSGARPYDPDTLAAALDAARHALAGAEGR